MSESVKQGAVVVRPADDHLGYKEAVKLARSEGWSKGWLRTWVDVEAVVEHGCWFDTQRGEAACAFYPKFLRLWRGPRAGEPFDLLPWSAEEFIITLYGWMRSQDE